MEMKAMNEMAMDDEPVKVNSIIDSEIYKENISAMFRIIWLSDKLKDTEIDFLRKINESIAVAWYDKSVIVSALTLSLLRHFDSNKINLLFTFYEKGENQIWQRALVGLVIALAFYNNRIAYYPDIEQRLKAIQGMKSSDKSVENIIIQYIRAKETEEITKKIQNEIIPEMMKIKSRLEEKLDLGNIISSAKFEDKNPEWETFFKDSPGIYNKLEEFSNLQMEGADVFLGAFAMLKQFNFFNEVKNWFIPFYKENDSLANVFEGLGEGVDISQFSTGIEKSNFLCNSDKYSFCLNVKHIPAFQKATVFELFNMEMKAMNEMAMDDELIHSDTRTKVIITQYFQDLYRFFKLHPFRNEMEDIFKLSSPLYDTRFFALWINDINIIRNIGEFYFEKNKYHDALKVFNRIIEENKNFELFEKIAYCYEHTGDFNKALVFYHKAEFLDKNKLWLKTRIAYCARRTDDFKKAVNYYKEAENLDPENLEIQVWLGQTYLEKEDYEKSLQHYFKVEYHQPDNYKVFRPISWCSFMLGKYENAGKYLHKAITIDATKHDYMNMGHILWSGGNTKKAIENYIMSIKSSDNDLEWFSNTLNEDSKYLIDKGIHSFDIALMTDYLRLSAKENQL